MYNDDPYNQPYDQGGANNTPVDPNGPGSPIWNRVVELYQLAMGRAPENDDVIRAHIQGAGGDFATLQQQIYASPEAQAYGARNANPAPQASPDAPVQQPGPTPGPAPAPTPAAQPTQVTNPGTQAAPPASAPSYTPPPAYVPPPAFQYADFNAPDPTDLLNDKAFQFENQQGMQAIGAKNAALGTLNTGGTIKDFQAFGQNLASTRYNDLFNRKLTEYGTNRGNALDAYNTNYGTQYKDPYSINYASQYTDPFAMHMQSAGLQQNNNQFNASLGQNNSQFNTGMDWNRYLQNYKATVTDPFSQKYSLLGLL